MIAGIRESVDRSVGSLSAMIQLTTSSITALSIMIGLVIVDWKIALTTTFLFGSSYIIVSSKNKQELKRNSYLILSSNQLTIKTVQESLGAIRDVLLANSQEVYIDTYRKADYQLRKLNAKNGFIETSPKYILEAFGLVIISLLGCLLVVKSDSSRDIIPVLGVLAFAAQRLLPALQQIYSCWSSVSGAQADLQVVTKMLNQPGPSVSKKSLPLPLHKDIRFDDVYYRYAADQTFVLKGLNLNIRNGECIGLIGSTGSGKSTLVDLLMGLLEPSSGQILVDGKNINDHINTERLASWQTSISHVPQTIFLADKSIAENIAFSIPEHLIDLDRIRKVAELAQLAEFIESTHNGYQSFVGERGVRLSGGQRQRIGIARALYNINKCNIMILDEATNALDGETEKKVLSSIQESKAGLTIIMITHRLSTIKYCDRVIKMSNGAISDKD